MAGVTQPGRFNAPPPIAPTNPSMLFGDPNTYSTAARTNAGDYDKIMAQYDDLIKGITSNPDKPLNYSPIAPQMMQYQPSSDVSGSLSNLSNLSASGGYSGGDIANIRARSISPIRSIYANAQRNLDRNKVLTGGYSPNYTAASTKMARDMSEQIGQRVTDVEGGIAHNVAQNKLSIAPSYASFASEADRTRMNVEQANAEAVNRVNEVNSRNRLDYDINNRQTDSTNRAQILSAVAGKQNLYGTTPALTSTFGNQVTQAAQLGQGQQQINNQKRDMWGRVIPVLG